MRKYNSSDKILFISPSSYQSSSKTNSDLIQSHSKNGKNEKDAKKSKKTKKTNNLRNYSKKTIMHLIHQILKNQEETRKKLNIISEILMYKFSDKKELNIDHFEISYNDKKKENLFNYFSIKLKPDETSKSASNTHHAPDIDKEETPIQSEIFPLKFNNINIKKEKKENLCIQTNENLDLNKYKIESNTNNSNDQDEDKKQIKTETDFNIVENININNEMKNIQREDELSSIDKIFSVNENKSQINSSQSEISSLQSSSSNVGKSTQERIKKVRGFNFKNNIKTKKLSKGVRHSEDIEIKHNNKEGIRKLFDLQKFFVKSKKEKDEKERENNENN